MTDNDPVLLDFCSRIFLQPERVYQASRLIDGAPLRTVPHKHDDAIQFDLALSCGGTVNIGRRAIEAKHATAFVFYPGVTHSHALHRTSSASEMLTFKVRVEPRWPLIRERPFKEVVQEVHDDALLQKALRRLAWLSSVGRNNSVACMTALAQALAVWPGREEGATRSYEWGDPKERLAPVLKLVDESLANPPGIPEMAEVGNVSARQLIRQFAAALGCTPHAYVTARRLARAKELLASGQLNVTEVAETLGFSTIHGFSRWFRQQARMNPSEFRERPL